MVVWTQMCPPNKNTEETVRTVPAQWFLLLDSDFSVHSPQIVTKELCLLNKSSYSSDVHAVKVVNTSSMSELDFEHILSE